MRLDRLVLENVRQYAGQHQLAFAKSRARNVTLIQGLNGTGKTHLLEALRWCLYGLRSSEEARDIVAKGALSEKEPGSEFETSVSLFFDHEGRSYEARRSIRVRVGSPLPDGGGMSFSATDVGLTLFEMTSAGAQDVSAPREEIRGMLPQNAADYFFFDGEQIDKFARPDNASGIRDAVNQVLKLANLDRAIDHLGAVAGDYEVRLRQLTKGSQLPQLLDAKQAREAERQELSEALGSRDRELASAKDARAQIEAELSRLAEAQTFILKRQSLKERLERFREQEQVLLVRLERLVIQAALVLGNKAVFQTVQFAQGKRKRGEIPSKVRQVVVQDLLQDRKCICGRDLVPGSPPHKVVEALGRQAVTSDLEERVMSAAVAYPSLLGRSDSLRDELTEVLGERSRLRKLAENAQADLTELDDQLKDVRQEDVKRLNTRRAQLEQTIQDLIASTARSRARIDDLTQAIRDLQTRIDREKLTDKEATNVQVRATLARSAAEALREIRGRFAAEVRQHIEDGTSEMFRKLVWKDSHFTRVDLSEDFVLSVVDKWGEPALGDLSAGETEVLSLAFIVTMGRVAGEAVDSAAPVVIDSPFGRLSAEPRESICRMLPALVDQLVLLVTDTELVGTEPALAGRIGARYELRFDPESSTTSIQEIRAS